MQRSSWHFWKPTSCNTMPCSRCFQSAKVFLICIPNLSANDYATLLHYLRNIFFKFGLKPPISLVLVVAQIVGCFVPRRLNYKRCQSLVSSISMFVRKPKSQYEFATKKDVWMLPRGKPLQSPKKDHKFIMSSWNRPFFFVRICNQSTSSMAGNHCSCDLQGCHFLSQN